MKSAHMTFPPFLLTISLLFWGWQSQLLLFAIPMAFILESPRWIQWRWQLSDKEINRVADLTSFLLSFSIIYLFIQHGSQGIFTLLNWLPILFFLLVFIQSYHIEDTVKLSALFITLRTDKQNSIASQRIDLRLPYLLICLLATSVGHNNWFFFGSYLFIIIGLWFIRPHRYPIYIWLILIINLGIFAYLGQIGIQQLQAQTERWAMSWLEEWLSIERDPYRQYTAIGDIGTLKQSDKIIWRVVARHPLLLREATYDTYFNQTWYTKQRTFTALPTQTDQTTWLLTNPLSQQAKSLRVIGDLSKGKGLLPLPMNSYQINDLPAISLQTNPLGTLKVEEGPNFIDYQVKYSSLNSLDTPPTEQDLEVPLQEQDYLQSLVTQLKLIQPQQAIQQLHQFFEHNFSYSLTLPTPTDRSTPLHYFLQQAHYGHCEYFATATVLLLRQAKIPARYAVGYAVDEYSDWEDNYVVRRRHAHAWALAYIDGQWQEVDNTPTIWREWEEEQASDWQLLSDIWSWISLRFTQWRWQKSEHTTEWFFILIPLILILFWRLYFKERIQTKNIDTVSQDKLIWPGLDSPFYQIIQQLTELGYARLPGENLTTWFKRIPHPSLFSDEMHNLLQLHQRYRFDPKGINQDELYLLQTLAKKWLKTYQTTQ